MKIGPKYKIVRRLGATVFEKTQTQKYALRAERRKEERRGGRSDYGIGMTEKQKARFFYGVNERQFARYVEKAVKAKGSSRDLFVKLIESRLDNVVVRAGFAPTRRAGRQMVSHGHIALNGKIIKVPSAEVRVGDKISIRGGSKTKGIFSKLDEVIKERTIPNWIKIDNEKKEISIEGNPNIKDEELLFNVSKILEFYTR